MCKVMSGAHRCRRALACPVPPTRQALHWLVLGSMFLTKLPALIQPLQWSPALRQDWKPQEPPTESLKAGFPSAAPVHGKLAFCLGKNLHNNQEAFRIS